MVTVRQSEVDVNVDYIVINCYKDTMEGIERQVIIEQYLKKYFSSTSRPIHKKDRFIVRANYKAIEF